MLIQVLNHPAGFHGDENVVQGTISSAVKTVTKDQNEGGFFSVVCLLLPHESDVKRWMITWGWSRSPLFGRVPKGPSLLSASRSMS